MSKEVSGGQEKLRAPERWPESSGRGLDDDFLIEAFPVKSGRFLRFGGVSRCLQEVGCVPGVPRISGEVQSSRTVA